MKYLFLILSATTLFACEINDKKGNPQEQKDRAKTEAAAMNDTARFTTIEWLDSTKQNLGEIKEGQVVEITWKFKNTGQHPLIVQDVQPGCGCTLASKPEEPIAPGAEGVIKAQFDSKGRPGHADKSMTVQANLKNHNAGSVSQLQFTADVKE